MLSFGLGDTHANRRLMKSLGCPRSLASHLSAVDNSIILAITHRQIAMPNGGLIQGQRAAIGLT